MKSTYLLVIIVCQAIMYGQTTKQKITILQNTNVEGLNSLSELFDISENARVARVAYFTRDNPDVQQKYVGIDGSLYEIKDIINGMGVYRSNQNRKSALGTRTSRLHSGGSLGLNLEGQNMLIGIWDGGSVLKTHVEFADDATPSESRVLTIDAPGVVSDSHATHVAGTLVAKGISADAKGMAPKAILHSYDWTNDMAEVTAEITNNSLLLSNHSYGVPVLNDQGNLNVPNWYMGCYNADARDWDAVAFNAPYYLMVTSAGNSGTDSYVGGLVQGFDKLTGEKNSKNNIVIANSNPFVIEATGALISNAINSSSSQGPSDDGRIKPDLTADGTGVFSTYNTATNSYATLSGTSMASPNASGSLLLLQQYYSQLHNGSFMRAASLKGLVCHTALESGTTAGPDARFGWGLLDSEKAAILIQKAKDVIPTSILAEMVLQQGESLTFQVTLNLVQKLSATLSWTDPAGVARDGQLNLATPALINDLDLRIIKSGEVNFPWKLQLSNIAGGAVKGDNTVDNVERVEVNNATGTYDVTISHKGILSGGSQAFSLIVSGFDATNLSITENKTDIIAIYPNPANTNLYYSFTGDANFDEVSIFDIYGKLIFTQKVFVESNQIDVSNLASGVYFARFTNSSNAVVKKFIKN